LTFLLVVVSQDPDLPATPWQFGRNSIPPLTASLGPRISDSSSSDSGLRYWPPALGSRNVKPRRSLTLVDESRAKLECFQGGWSF